MSINIGAVKTLEEAALALQDLARAVDELQRWKLQAVASRTVTAATTVDVTDSLVLVNASGGAVTVTLPLAASGIAARPITVKKIDASANAVTIARTGTDTIDGAASVAMTVQYQTYTLQPVTGGWAVV